MHFLQATLDETQSQKFARFVKIKYNRLNNPTYF